jgi:hypothetical protein
MNVPSESASPGLDPPGTWTWPGVMGWEMDRWIDG